jgi:hypothetical protein
MFLSAETANRTLEEMDIVFATDTPFVWKAEKELRENKGALIEKAKEAKAREQEKHGRSVGVDRKNIIDTEKQNGIGLTEHKEFA